VEEQAIRFTADDLGRRIAWTSSGSGPPLVFSGWWMNHLELNWLDPPFRAYVEALGRHRTVLRYDTPGTGLSAADETAPVAGVEEEAAALAAVVARAGEGPVDLFAGSSGVPIAIAFAVAHPERVGRLLLYGGYASGSRIADERSRRAIVALVREHWGLGSRALADVFLPGADATERERFVDFQRRASSAEGAARSLEGIYRFDVADRLGRVPPGATVLHRREDRGSPSRSAASSPRGCPTRPSSPSTASTTSPGSATPTSTSPPPSTCSGSRSGRGRRAVATRTRRSRGPTPRRTRSRERGPKPATAS
jgi:pimeloyl-ACP methyl ester carboxylesterase